jgi:hypothetical protein
VPSASSYNELQSLHSDASEDQNAGVPLKQIVAIYRMDDGRPFFVSYTEDESSQASAMMLQFSEPEERDVWLTSIRSAANHARLRDPVPISAYYSHLAARVVERERDYDPKKFAIFRAIQRSSLKSGARSSTDDLAKIGMTACFVAIGIHMVHIIPITKNTNRGSSSPSFAPLAAQESFGILCLSALWLNDGDDSFELVFRLVKSVNNDMRGMLRAL